VSNPRIATWVGVSSFSQFTGADLNNPLPLGLMAFIARNENNQGLLSWTMSQENGITGYEVEKSLDGKSFSKIGYVSISKSKTSKIEYQFTDADLKTSNYYRIKLISEGDKKEYSQIAIIRTGLVSKLDMQLYPNPSHSGARLMIDGDMNISEHVDVRIFGLDGKENGFLNGPLSEVNERFEAMVIDLPAGVFQVRVLTQEHAQTLRLIKR